MTNRRRQPRQPRRPWYACIGLSDIDGASVELCLGAIVVIAALWYGIVRFS